MKSAHIAALAVSLSAVVLVALIILFVTIPYCPNGTYQDFGQCVALSPAGQTSDQSFEKLLRTAPAYVINMARSAGHYAVAKQRLADAGFGNVQRFDAVDGKAADLPAVWATHTDTPGFQFGRSAKVDDRAVQGCLLSWLGLLRQIADGPDPIVFAFEDDIVFHTKWAARAAEFYTVTPCDFDVVYLGFLSVYVIGTTPIVRAPTFCTHAMMLTRSGAETLYRALLTHPAKRDIDGMLNEMQWQRSKCPFKYYCWNYRDWSRMFTGAKGLVYQDKNMPSTILRPGARY